MLAKYRVLASKTVAHYLSEDWYIQISGKFWPQKGYK